GADGLVTLGGGSPLEIARSVAALDVATLDGDSLEGRVRRANPDPLIAISTTLSQAEFSKTFGFRTPAGVKEVRTHPRLGPDYVILDADLAMHTPTSLWISSGVKALDTALAVLCSSLSMQASMREIVLRGID